MTTPLVRDTFVKISPQERNYFFSNLKAKANLDSVGIYLKSGDTYVYFGTADKFTEAGYVITDSDSNQFTDIVWSTDEIPDFSKAVDLYYRVPLDPDRGLVKNEFTPVPPYEPVLNTTYRDLFVRNTVYKVEGLEFYFKEGDDFKQVVLADLDHNNLYFKQEDGIKHKSVANFYYKYTPPPPIVESVNGGKSRRRIRKRRQKTKRRSSRRNNKRR